jgi:UDP-N-acetylmuramate--alanine ligase
LNIRTIHSVYFIGIGGIGMSALARYFKNEEKNVAGYDRTMTALTNTLEDEGCDIHFDDDIALIPDSFKNEKDKVLVIYTPAIPQSHSELNYFINNDFEVIKRSKALGLIIKDKKGIAVAGTHGKTTVSSIITHIFDSSELGCSAFLGGILTKYNSNYIANNKSEVVIVEADEYDRSFLQLSPAVAVITSMDADHLDIYGDLKTMVISFNQFAEQVQKNGILLINSKISSEIQCRDDILKYTYSLEDKSDFYVRECKIEQGKYIIAVASPFGIINDIEVSIPGKINVENTVAAIAVAMLQGIESDHIRSSVSSFEGIKRRFEYIINDNDLVYIDDYAHHPEELSASISSVSELYPDKKITGIFQPHLFSRTRDFADEFAVSLSMLDELILLDIYPARELPIENVDARLIYDKIKSENKTLTTLDNLVDVVKTKDVEILITLGAGSIDKMVEPIKNYLLKNK